MHFCYCKESLVVTAWKDIPITWQMSVINTTQCIKFLVVYLMCKDMNVSFPHTQIVVYSDTTCLETKTLEDK